MKSKQKLELVHFDVCGQFNVKSNGFIFYLLTLIDEFIIFFWIYLIDKKSDVFTQFKKFKRVVDKQSDCSIYKLRIDGGGEYISCEFS